MARKKGVGPGVEQVLRRPNPCLEGIERIREGYREHYRLELSEDEARTVLTDMLGLVVTGVSQGLDEIGVLTDDTTSDLNHADDIQWAGIGSRRYNFDSNARVTLDSDSAGRAGAYRLTNEDMDQQTIDRVEATIAALEQQARDPYRRQRTELRIGYRVDADAGPAAVSLDEDGAIVVRTCFCLAASGYSYRFILKTLNKEGLLPYRGLTLGTAGISTILNDRFYCGEIMDADGRWIPGGHEAVVSAELFERSQEQVSERRYPPRDIAALYGPLPSDVTTPDETQDF